MNWAAMRAGEERHSPDVEHEADYHRVRPGTKSELSVPVRVEGRVIGVVNLESSDPDNYHSTALQSAARAFASQIGATLVDARLVLSRVSQELATEVITRRHDFAAESLPVKDLSEQVDDPRLKRKLDRIAESIDRRARTLRDFDVEAVRPAPFPAIVADIVDDVGLVLETPFQSMQPGVWTTYDSGTTRLIRECLRHVVLNVKQHGARDAGRRPEIVVKHVTWGGQAHDLVTVTHRVGAEFDPEQALDLYRVPLDIPDLDAGTGGRPRFGAYLAGIRARQLGGDVFLRALADGRVAVTAMIPNSAVEPLTPTMLEDTDA